MSMYSPLFASGLQAPHTPRPSEKQGLSLTIDSSPMPVSSPIPSSPLEDAFDLDSTPRATNLLAVPKQTHQLGSPKRTRKRRSSITIAASPLASVKSPVRHAKTARDRAGSVNNLFRDMIPEQPTINTGKVTNENGTPDTSILGRMRSGSVGFARKMLGRKRFLRPAPPPPTAPLPPLPNAASVAPIPEQLTYYIPTTPEFEASNWPVCPPSVSAAKSTRPPLAALEKVSENWVDYPSPLDVHYVSPLTEVKMDED